MLSGDDWRPPIAIDHQSDSWRRALGRALTREAQAPVAELLNGAARPLRRIPTIGITGPPGAGKSSLIAKLAERRLARDRSLGILAIDPTSPRSGGSILGDRIRMDAVSDSSRLFIRSTPSGASYDGLCRNAVGMADVFAEAGFDELIMETVGVGQINYDARLLVDVLVLVLVPESGDAVQAMKAGILEMADIYVVNKSDLPSASKVVADLQSMMGLKGRGKAPPVVMTSTRTDDGLDQLDDLIEARLRAGAAEADEVARARQHYHLRSLLTQRLDEIWAGQVFNLDDRRPESFNDVLRSMMLDP